MERVSDYSQIGWKFLLICAVAGISAGFMIHPVLSVPSSIGSKVTRCTPRPLQPKAASAVPVVETEKVDEEVPMLVLDSESTQEKVDRLMREAAFFYRKRYYPKALRSIGQVLRYDPTNEQAKTAQIQVKNAWEDSLNPSEKTLQTAGYLFGTSDFAGSARLYLQYLAQHPESKEQILPLVLKCYYNLGVIALRQGRCDLASEYFQQNLLMDPKDVKSERALLLVNDCHTPGSAGQFLTLPLAE